MSTAPYSPVCPCPPSVPGVEPRHFDAVVRGRPQEDDLGIAGTSAAMQRLRLQVRRIGPHFRSVLVSGEAGAGKDLTVLALHRMSRGSDGPFVVCDAATLEYSKTQNDGVDEDGHTSCDRISRLMRAARQGTLFLDRIGEMPLEAQAQLLRVLRRYEWAQEETSTTQGIGTRIIATTDEDLRIMASAGRFRMELYQKIAMVGIVVPPLRERLEDIDELAMRSLAKFARAYGKKVDAISGAAMQRLKEHGWPGNVRELENIMRCGVLQSDGGLLELHDLGPFEPGIVNTDPTPVGSMRLQDVVERHVLQVLKSCDGNKLRAAETLGISRSTLYRMLDDSAVNAQAFAR